MVTVNRKIATICLILATWTNPFGFDVAFATILSWTGGYWTTTLIFYCLSALFFGLFFYFSKMNPLIFFREKLRNTILTVRKLFK
jgi:hypothetical protein